MRAVCLLLIVACGAPAATVYHMIGIGQSLSVGRRGCPVLSSTQPYSNLTLSGNTSGTLIPLVENTVLAGSPCDPNPNETPGSGAANTLTLLSPGFISLSTNHGVSGQPYASLKKGTTPYTNSMTAVDNAKAAVIAAGNTYICGGLRNEHGEDDYRNHVTATTYEADLVEWQSDYQTDCITKTSQVNPVPMFLDQMHAWTVYNSGTCPTIDGTCGAAPSTTIGQWWVARDHPLTHYLVGPKYQLEYSADGVHLTNNGYLALGELHGKVMYQVLVLGNKWKPLAPRSIVLSGGNTITIAFWTNYGLAFDTTTVTDAGNCKGFVVYTGASTASKITCNSAAISGNSVVLTLASAPSATAEVAYAYEGTSGQGGGTTGGPHGNLRNSDPTLGQSGNHLYDWGITFREAVGFVWGVPTMTLGAVSLKGSTAIR